MEAGVGQARAGYMGAAYMFGKSGRGLGFVRVAVFERFRARNADVLLEECARLCVDEYT